MITLEFVPSGSTLLGRATVQTRMGPIVLNASTDRSLAEKLCARVFKSDSKVCQYLKESGDWSSARYVIGQQIDQRLPPLYVGPPIPLPKESREDYDQALLVLRQARLFNPKVLSDLNAMLESAIKGDVQAQRTMALIDLVDAYTQYMATLSGVDVGQAAYHKPPKSCCASCKQGGPCEVSCGH